MDKIQGKTTKIQNIILNFILIILAVIFAVPLYLAAVNVFKPTPEISAHPIALPNPPILENIISVFNNPNVDLYQMYFNSICITLFGASICMLISSMAAYYLVHAKNKAGNFLYIYFLFGLMVPYAIVYVPLVMMFNKFGIPGNLLTLIIVFISGSISFSVFLYYGFMGGIPKELEEAAIMDGASQSIIFFRIIMPLVKPCSTTVAIFIGLSMWNDFLTPLLIGQVKTITVGIYTAIGPHASNWGEVFTYVMFATLPVIILYLFAQKQFISGLTSGAVKG